MMVSNVKGQIFEIGPGVCGTEVEATVNTDNGHDVFVYVNIFEGIYGLMVTKKSVYGTNGDLDSLDKEDYIERYNDITETKKSSYRKVFAVLDKVCKLIEG